MDPAFIAGLVDNIQANLYVLLAEGVLYGIYAALFAFYLHVLHTGGISNNRFLTVATISLFLLCSTHFSLVTASTILDNRISEALAIGLDLGDDETSNYVGVAVAVVYVTSNAVADSIFIFRCYAIWNFRRTILIIPAVLAISCAVLGYLDVFWSASDFGDWDFSFSFITTLAMLPITVSLLTTLILMGLSVGRIWWLARTARKVMGKRITSRYYTICAMILESGALYCVGGILYVIFTIRTYNTTRGTILGQLVGITPTIIAVRVGLGKSVESVNSFIATARPRARSPLEFQPAVPSARAVESRVLYLQSDEEEKVGPEVNLGATQSYCTQPVRLE
ncbi:hypothetical protein DFH07DRAFT_1065536 [Mycena maculata]|uniref:Uncharacterized protein n=1 Tax=Mycena maculata TaxID=230809 RepID=A0AAD7I172_9AGAR|nr:hypothetical protein DFH07DRAFT_1065536 [Mycena maculata]